MIPTPCRGGDAYDFQ